MLHRFQVFIGERLASHGKWGASEMLKCLRSAIRQTEGLTEDAVSLQWDCGVNGKNRHGLTPNSVLFSKGRKEYYKRMLWNVNVYSFEEVDKWSADFLAEDMKKERERKARCR